jgi:hypothetical protein
MGHLRKGKTFGKAKSPRLLRKAAVWRSRSREVLCFTALWHNHADFLLVFQGVPAQRTNPVNTKLVFKRSRWNKMSIYSRRGDSS